MIKWTKILFLTTDVCLFAGNLIYGAHPPHEMFQVDDLWITLALQEEETQKNGLVFLFDMENFPWKFLRYFTPHIIRVSTAKAEVGASSRA